MNKIISTALQLGLWKELDVRFAYMLSGKSPNNAFILAVMSLSANYSYGHVCLPLTKLAPNTLFDGRYVDLAAEALNKSGNLSINHWEEFLLSNSSISDGSRCTPLILDKQRLYLSRMWHDECLIAKFFRSIAKKSISFSETQNNYIIKLLNQYFPVSLHESKIINWQKVAVAISLISQLLIISGGPGTGKTITISKLLGIILLLYTHNPLTIKIAAFTGKASVRLNKTINIMINQLNLSDVYNKCFLSSIKAVTLHKLLSDIYNNNLNSIDKKTMFADILIIDETSMVDLNLMAQIIDVLPDKIKVILVGDYKQLFSIKPGSIFSDICKFIGRGYTDDFCCILKKITNYTLPKNITHACSIINNLCLLNKNYRFDSKSGIGKLTHAVSLGKSDFVLSLLSSNQYKDLHYKIIRKQEDYYNMLIQCSLTYYNFLKGIHLCSKNIKYILNIFDQYRLLCVLREGPFGVLVLNMLIEKLLHQYGIIYLKNNNLNYIGRPIIITANEPSLPLFNGELGILLPDHTGEHLLAYFLISDDEIKSIPIYKLPKHESSFVITIHKSQGSEFQNVVLMLPDKIVPILTRELFYTGVSRACKNLLIYGTNRIIQHAVKNPTKRWSGLVDRLK